MLFGVHFYTCDNNESNIMNTDYIIKEMSTNEKTLFLQSFLYLIRADGKVDNAEKELISGIIKFYQIPPEIFKKIDQTPKLDIMLKQIQETVPNRKHALFLIKELLTMANIDDDISDNEIYFIQTVAQTLNVEEEKILAINELIQKRMIWLYENNVVMEYEP